MAVATGLPRASGGVLPAGRGSAAGGQKAGRAETLDQTRESPCPRAGEQSDSPPVKSKAVDECGPRSPSIPTTPTQQQAAEPEERAGDWFGHRH